MTDVTDAESGPMTIPGPDTRIIVDQVTKRFTLRHSSSLKELVVWTLRGRKEPLTNQFVALTDVSFHINDGETVALLGLNGSGKSTLLKLISGVMRADDGQVMVRGNVAGLIEVGAGFHPDLTGRENVHLNGAILGMTEAQIDDRFDDIVAFSEIPEFIDTEVKFYSSGMFLRLAFSVAVHTEPDIFLVDEILAVGDEPFQRKCLARIRELKAAGHALVIVSHDLNMVADLCERGILLEQGKLIVDGPVETAVAEMRARF
jgi:ABC-2 type transport system ATP-binding protein